MSTIRETITKTLRAEAEDGTPSALSFGKGNAKLGKQVVTFSLPAGYTCPGARDCMALADRTSGKIADGPDTVFRCFAASAEAMYPSTRDQRWRNYRALEAAAKAAESGGLSAAEGMRNAILAALPAKAAVVRIHVSGDFYRPAYADAWRMVAQERPAVLFYAYTKSLAVFVGKTLPANFRVTASVGGRQDSLIPASGLRTATVVYSEAEAAGKGLAIDHDDSHAMGTGPSFALLIHGTQPKGSKAAAALKGLKAAGWTGYGKAAGRTKGAR